MFLFQHSMRGINWDLRIDKCGFWTQVLDCLRISLAKHKVATINGGDLFLLPRSMRAVSTERSATIVECFWRGMKYLLSTAGVVSLFSVSRASEVCTAYCKLEAVNFVKCAMIVVRCFLRSVKCPLLTEGNFFFWQNLRSVNCRFP